jgi:hypothetical protein
VSRKKHALLAAVAAVLIGGVFWLALQPRDPLFHGKPESEWIKGIAYGMSLTDAQNQEQVQRWRDFGPAGLDVLARALNEPPPGRTYRQIYRRLAPVLPSFLARCLPAPMVMRSGGPRLIVADLLRRMGPEARPAWPAVARALADEDPSLRQMAISFFTHPENDEAFLNQMPARDKKKLLPLFINALQEGGANGWGLRNNAAIALKYYSGEAPLAALALAKALQDTAPQVRLRAADALHRVDADAAKKAGAVTVLIQLLRDSDGQVASRAAFVLRDFDNEAQAAVPALIEALNGASLDVACNAVWSLHWSFPQQGDLIMPALRKAALRKDSVGGYARAALQYRELNQKEAR